MKQIIRKAAAALLLVLLVGGCQKKVSNPENNDVDSAREALGTISQQMDDAANSRAMDCLAQAPTVNDATVQALMKNAFTEDIIADYLYLMIPKGTYFIESNTSYTFVPQPADELILRFPYTDPETGITHDAMWRYHDIQLAATELSVRFQVQVDYVTYVSVQFVLKGTGFEAIEQMQYPDIVSTDITGFFINDNDERCDTRFYYSQLTAGFQLSQAGGDSIHVEVTNPAAPLAGGPGRSTAKQQSADPIQFNIYVPTSHLYLSVNWSGQDAGLAGFIEMWYNRVADIISDNDGNMEVHWDNGYIEPLEAVVQYMNSLLASGGAIS